MEEASNTYYVVSKHKKDGSATYFNCNRSKTGKGSVQSISIIMSFRIRQ
jgi:hypothetical protein